jgi:hypothetical protein
VSSLSSWTVLLDVTSSSADLTISVHPWMWSPAAAWLAPVPSVWCRLDVAESVSADWCEFACVSFDVPSAPECAWSSGAKVDGLPVTAE